MTCMTDKTLHRLDAQWCVYSCPAKGIESRVEYSLGYLWSYTSYRLCLAAIGLFAWLPIKFVILSNNNKI